MAAYTTITATTGTNNLSSVSSYTGSPTIVPGWPQTITSVANNGSGLIRITVASVTPAWVTNDQITITGVLGTTEANGVWLVTLISNTGGVCTLDLQGSTFTNAYISGGIGVRGDTISVRGYVIADSALPNPWIVGTSPSTNTAAITVSNIVGNGSFQGRLTVNTNILCRGALSSSSTGPGDITFNSVGIEFDNTHATTAVNYAMNWVGTSTGTITFNGSALSRCYMRSTSGGAVATVSGNGGATTAKLVATYTDFSYIGDSSHDGFFAVYNWDIQNSTFDHCGRWNITAGIFSGTSFMNLDYCTFTSGQSTALVSTVTAVLNMTLDTGTHANSGGTRNITHCSFDGDIAWTTNAANFTINDCVFGNNAHGFAASPTLACDSFQRNFVMRKYGGSASGPTMPGTVKDCYFMGYNQSNNGYLMTVPGLGDVDSSHPIVDGCIFENPNASTTTYAGGPTTADSDTGDCIQTPTVNPASLVTLTVARCIILPISSGHLSDGYACKGLYSGTLLTGRGASLQSNIVYRFYHNTAHCDAGTGVTTHGSIIIAEQADSTVGQCSNYQSNINWSRNASGSTTTPIWENSTSTVVNGITPANVTNNCNYQIATFSSMSGTAVGTVYKFHASGATPGANDTTANPQFVDDRRCFVKWVRTIIGDLGSGVNYTGAANSDEDILTLAIPKMLAIYNPADVHYDARFTQQALLAYVRAGFAPTNSALSAAGHDGVDIGAVAGVFGSVIFRDSSQPMEYLSALLRNNNQFVEYLSGIVREKNGPEEWLASPQRDNRQPLEYLSSILRDNRQPIEYLASLVTDDKWAAEYLASARMDAQIPAEWSGAVMVTLDAKFPVEWLGAVNRDERMPGEYLVTILRDAPEGVEYLKGVQLDSPQALEWLGSANIVLVDASIPIEWRSNLATPCIRVLIPYKQKRILNQTPVEVLDYTINWSSLLNGDTIVSSTFAASSPDVLISNTDIINSGTETIFWLTGGLPQNVYFLTNTITTAGGREFQDSFICIVEG